MDPELLARTFPPRWQLGQIWTVETETEGGIVRRLRPGERRMLVRNVFNFKIVAVPGPDEPSYRVRVTQDNSIASPTELHYRAEPFSLSGAFWVHLDPPDLSERFTNGPQPYIKGEGYAIIADFPIAPPPDAPAEPLRFNSPYGGQPLYDWVTQVIETQTDRVILVLETAHVAHTFVWRPGEPWWDTYERTRKGFGSVASYTNARGWLRSPDYPKTIKTPGTEISADDLEQ